MFFSTDSLALTVAQAACVALPGAGIGAWADRLRTPFWALVLPLPIILIIAAVALVPSTAGVITWVALILVPLGGALALGWAAHGARPWLAVLAPALLALAWTHAGDRGGQTAATLLIAGSAVTLGRLLAGAAPRQILKAGVVALAAVDAYLVFSNTLQAPNDALDAAVPAPGLPQLQSASFGFAGLGYDDFFVAAVVGALLATQPRRQLAAALALVAASLAWDQLFAFYDVLPATVPPAVVLLLCDTWRPAARRDTARAAWRRAA
ncbi:MAG TPA: hypothetical protein VHZ75_00100 [Solirubrobacteraceae bacterium]|jgi:hypothetical protein|nr:hypothetical protein [Solirubrobacteraceae bacterium]